MSARQTRFVRPNSDVPGNIRRALVTLIDTLEREQSEDSVDLSALNAAIAAAQLQINALLEQLEDIDLNGALTPQQEFELALVTQVDTILGSVSQLVVDSIKRSEKAAAAVIESLLKGRKNEIAIRVEQAARLTDREAFVSQISEFSAQIGLAQASITEEIQARSDGDNALALVDQQITSALNGNVAQVQILTESVNGIEARWGVAINQNGQVTGLIQLDGEATGSTFTIVANNFRVAQPGSAGGGAVPVWAIGTVNGVTKLVQRLDMYADGAVIARVIAAGAVTADKIAANSVTASKIAAGAVTADKIAAGAITADKIAANEITADKIAINGLTGNVVSNAFADNEITMTSFNFVQMPGMSLTVTLGANEKVLVTFTASSTRSVTRPAMFELRMNGVRVSNSPSVFYPFAYIQDAFLPIAGPSASFTLILSPPAGTHTFTIWWRNVLAGGATVYNNYRYFAAMRFLK